MQGISKSPGKIKKEIIMNKSELIDAMASKTGLSKKDTEATLKAFTEVVTETLKKDEKVQLTGFVTFQVSKRKERKGRNPKTGEDMIIPAARVATAKMSKILK